ncbi:MAG: aminotransferase class V-fold PLP-dependent enzyme [Bacteroidota bacterium]
MSENNSIVNKLNSLQDATKAMEPLGQDLDDLTQKVINHGHQFLRKINDLDAYKSDEGYGDQLAGTEFNEEGYDIDKLLKVVAKDVDGPGIQPASGGHLGYIPGGGVYPSALGDYLAAVANKYAGVYYASPGAVQLENQVIRWIAKMIGFPEPAHGNLTSGGSIANLIGIVTARDMKGISSDKIKKSCIYLTKQAHHSLHKAIRIAGLGEAVLREIDVDERFRLDLSYLKSQVQSDIEYGLTPFMVIGSAGTTDTGAIDPLDDIATLCKEYNLWFHIDAAYGGFFVLVNELKKKLKGIEKADSVTIDPHKGLFLAYGLGAVIIKDVTAMKQSHYYRANYMQDVTEIEAEPSPADLSPELTKHFRGLRMWLPLQLFGVKVFRQALEEKVLLCQYFYQKIQEIGFEVGPEPELSVCIYRYTQGVDNPNKFNDQLIKAVQEHGRIFISSTTIDGTYWLRLAVMSFRTHLNTINELLGILEQKKDELISNK